MPTPSPSTLLARIREHQDDFIPLLSLSVATQSLYGRVLSAIFAYLNINAIQSRAGVSRARLHNALIRIDEALSRRVDPAEILLFKEFPRGPRPKYSDEVLLATIQSVGPDGRKKTIKQIATELDVNPTTVVRTRIRLRSFLRT
mgnify:CR=1 FL=1